MRHRHEDPIETLAAFLLSIAAVPVVLSILIALVALCYTVVWHIGNWVGWW